MTLEQLNAMPAVEAREEFLRCCGSRAWAEAMIAGRPYSNREALFGTGQKHWDACGKADRQEAFDHHPRIGEQQLRERFGSTAKWAGQEQAGVAQANEAVLADLAKGNRDYEERFGHIFLVCATGKSAPEMLELLMSRMGNDPKIEFDVACGEQAKITRIRLEKLLS